MSASPHLATAASAPELRMPLPVSAEELKAMVAAAVRRAAEEAVASIVADEQVISLAEAVALTPWTESGFKRVATKENLPFIKGPHKSPPSYRRGAVIAMLQRMQVWPKGRPVEVLPFHQAA